MATIEIEVPAASQLYVAGSMEPLPTGRIKVEDSPSIQSFIKRKMVAPAAQAKELVNNDEEGDKKPSAKEKKLAEIAEMTDEAKLLELVDDKTKYVSEAATKRLEVLSQ